MKFKLVLEGELEQDLITLKEYVKFGISQAEAASEIVRQANEQGGFTEPVMISWNLPPQGLLEVKRS
jgi:hypothetical protein